MPIKQTFSCSECGGQNVEALAWVNPNGDILGDYAEGFSEPNYCKDCDTTVGLDIEVEEICPIHEVEMNFKGGGCASCFADQESAECAELAEEGSDD